MNFGTQLKRRKRRLKNALEYYRGEAATDGWPEEEMCVVWGEIKEAPERTDHRTKIEWEKTHDLALDPWPWDEIEEVYDLQLQPIKEQANESG